MTPEAATPETSQEPMKPVAPLTIDRWQLSEHLFALHSITAPPGYAAEDLLRPEAWANIARNLRPGEIVQARSEEGTWFIELYVWEKGQNWALVSALRLATRPEAGPAKEPADAFEIEWRGPVKKFRIIRKSDKAELKAGFETREAANVWLADYRRTVAA